MPRPLFCLLIFFSGLSSCHFSEKEKKIKLQPVDDLAPQHSQIDTSILQHFKDSGQLMNGAKEGMWVEYSIDTSLVQSAPAEIAVGDKRIRYSPTAALLKETGWYTNNVREALWTSFKSNEKTAPFYWKKYAVRKYQGGKKHGEETIYQQVGEDLKPLAIMNWKNGVEDGVGKLYYYQPPFNLKKQYVAEDGKLWPLEFYYLGGKLQSRFTDTVINGQKLKYFEDYFESGKLKKTGFYLENTGFGTWTSYFENGKTESEWNYTDGKLNGAYKYYYDNGQLWTERTYKNGALMEVLTNFSRQGVNQDPGTLKNGTGAIYLYDEAGTPVDTLHYIDGWTQESTTDSIP